MPTGNWPTSWGERMGHVADRERWQYVSPVHAASGDEPRPHSTQRAAVSFRRCGREAELSGYQRHPYRHGGVPTERSGSVCPIQQLNGSVQGNVQSYSTVEPAIDLTASSFLAFSWQICGSAFRNPIEAPLSRVETSFAFGKAYFSSCVWGDGIEPS